MAFWDSVEICGLKKKKKKKKYMQDEMEFLLSLSFEILPDWVHRCFHCFPKFSMKHRTAVKYEHV